jgi:arylsulfatase A-like enzyme
MNWKSILLRCVLVAAWAGFTYESASKGDPTPSPRVEPEKDRHVVVIVWDGMRPDLVTERNTPTLWKLLRDGVVFRHHHSVYPTATDINGAAIATGAYPDRNGLLANREFRPQIDPQRPFENADPEIIKKGDETSGGKYLAVPTIAEIVHAAGRRTAVAGTKSVAFLHDRHAEWSSAVSKGSLIRFAAAPMPSNVREDTLRLLGRFLTEPADTNEQRNTYATKALIAVLWRDAVPAFSLLWLSEPDLSQHEYSPGAEPSMNAIRGSDNNLAAVLDALSKKNARETTDLLIVSDHGFSTVERAIDFRSVLAEAGFDAVTAFEQTPKSGQIMVVENGGTVLFYVIGHDHATSSRLVEWLQHSDFAGAIFAREKFEGTFPFGVIHGDTPDAPDVIVALRWNRNPNRFGVPGQIITDKARSSGQGSHATLSEFDVHNTLIAQGPDFRRGFSSDLPSGNVDVAPTVLRILELDRANSPKFDGRVLVEAMNNDSSVHQGNTQTLEATRQFSSGQWRQYIKISHVGDKTYVDEGNGSFQSH